MPESALDFMVVELPNSGWGFVGLLINKCFTVCQMQQCRAVAETKLDIINIYLTGCTFCQNSASLSEPEWTSFCKFIYSTQYDDNAFYFDIVFNKKSSGADHC